MKIEEVEMALDMHYQTEIVTTRPLVNELGDGLVSVRARGAITATYRQQYVRPMFEVMPAPRSAAFLVRQVPCADCGDFSRSWNCEVHTYWSPIGDEDDLTEDVMVPGIRRMLAEGHRVPPTLLPPVVPRENFTAHLGGLQDFSINFEITEAGMAVLNEALASGPRRRMESRDED